MMSSQIVDDQLIQSDEGFVLLLSFCQTNRNTTEAEFKKSSKWRASLRHGLKKTRKLTSTIKQTTQEQLQRINDKRVNRDDKVRFATVERIYLFVRLTRLNAPCLRSHRHWKIRRQRRIRVLMSESIYNRDGMMKMTSSSQTMARRCHIRPFRHQRFRDH